MVATNTRNGAVGHFPFVLVVPFRFLFNTHLKALKVTFVATKLKITVERTLGRGGPQLCGYLSPCDHESNKNTG